MVLHLQIVIANSKQIFSNFNVFDSSNNKTKSLNNVYFLVISNKK